MDNEIEWSPKRLCNVELWNIMNGSENKDGKLLRGADWLNLRIGSAEIFFSRLLVSKGKDPFYHSNDQIKIQGNSTSLRINLLVPKILITLIKYIKNIKNATQTSVSHIG